MSGSFFHNALRVILSIVILILCARAEAQPVPTTSPATRPSEPAELPSRVGDTIINSIGMKLTYIPAGEFVMGSPPGECTWKKDELQHNVKITKPFLMGTTEVTQAQWKAVMGNNPSWFKGDDNLPVEKIAWKDANEFCRKLSEKEERTYRLPTEAQWEYACRAGTKTRFYGGDAERDLPEIAWFEENSNSKTHMVGQKRANAWGLYDMHGNVQEWCEDWYGPYPAGETIDPIGPEKGESHVFRGGSWIVIADGCRAARREWSSEVYRDKKYGFRVVAHLKKSGP